MSLDKIFKKVYTKYNLVRTWYKDLAFDDRKSHNNRKNNLVQTMYKNLAFKGKCDDGEL